MTLTTQELQRVTVLMRVEGGQLTAVQAAALIGRSERQVRRLLARYRQGGAAGRDRTAATRPSRSLIDEIVNGLATKVS